MSNKTKKNYIIAIAIPLVLGVISWLLTMKNMNIYDDIITPTLSPPMWTFPIVWSTLFVLMGISSGIIYQYKQPDNNEQQKEAVFDALYIYAVQLFLNFFWGIFFFNMRAFLFAFVWLVVLWFAILIMIFKFYKINSKAAYLQISYLIWVTFAGYLTFGVYWLNM